MIYLDSAATTLIKPNTVARNAAWAINNLTSVGRGQYNAAEKSAEVVYNCREKAAKLFNVGKCDDIVMCFNATHALNIAISTLAFKDCRAVVSGYEHNAVMRPLRYAGANIIIAESPLFDRDAAISAFEKAISNKPDLAVCTVVSNVFGFIMPIYEIAEICRKHKVPLIIDASQGAGALDLNFAELGADFMAMPGHKGLYGPQGTGLLLCSRMIEPLLSGGTGGDSRLMTMPNYLPDIGEAGTHNIPGIAGLSAGLDYVLKITTAKILKHEQSLVRTCINELERIPKVKVFATHDLKNQSGVVSFTVDGIESNAVSDMLSRRGICVRAGLHCAPLAHETAGTVKEGTVRVSFSAFSEKWHVYALATAVKEICKFNSVQY